MATASFKFAESGKSDFESNKVDDDAKNAALSAALFEESEFYIRKWSGPLILGPFLPAVFAVFIIVVGNIVLHTWTGTCNFALDSFVTAAVAISYLFLLIYTWVFFGDELFLTIPIFKYRMRILRPFRGLKELTIYYMVILFISFIVWAVGSQLVASGIYCVTTAPVLYQFSLFVCVIYWLNFICLIVYLIKLKFGNLIDSFMGQMTRERTNLELEELIFKREWMKIDILGKYYMDAEDFPLFLTNLGIPMPPDMIEKLIKEKLEPNNENKIDFYKARRWFREFSSDSDAKAGPDDVVPFDEGDGEANNGVEDAFKMSSKNKKSKSTDTEGPPSPQKANNKGTGKI